MLIWICEGDSGTILEARELSKARNRVFRAPHHTVSQAALTGELAISAGGVLYLDEAEQFRSVALNAMLGTMAFMHPDARPYVVMALAGELSDKVLALLVRTRALADEIWEGRT